MAKAKKKPVPVIVPTASKKPTTRKKPAAKPAVGSSVPGSATVWWIIIAIFLITLSVLGAIKYGETIGRGPNKPDAADVLGVVLDDEKKVQVDSFAVGRQEGLQRSGIRMVSLEDLEKIANEAIDKHCSGEGYKRQSTALSRKAVQKSAPNPAAKAVK